MVEGLIPPLPSPPYQFQLLSFFVDFLATQQALQVLGGVARLRPDVLPVVMLHLEHLGGVVTGSFDFCLDSFPLCFQCSDLGIQGVPFRRKAQEAGRNVTFPPADSIQVLATSAYTRF